MGWLAVPEEERIFRGIVANGAIVSDY